MSRVSNPSKSQPSAPPPEAKGANQVDLNAAERAKAEEEMPSLDELCAEEIPDFSSVDVTTPRASLDEVRPKLDELLATGWFNRVDGGEARAVVDELAKLSPADLKTALEELDKGGSLSELVSAASDRDKTRLCDLAVSAGLVEKRVKPKPEGAFDPPAPIAFPATYLAPKRQVLSKGMQELVDGGNAAAKERYARDYSAYKGRYIDAIKNAGSAAEIRRLGPPVEDADKDINVACYEKLASLRGETPAGEMGVFAEGSIKHQGAEVKVSGEVGRMGARGSVDGSSEVTGSVDGGEITVKQDGSVKVGLSEGADEHKRGVSVTLKDGEVTSAEVASGSTKLGYDEGKVSVEVEGKNAKVAFKSDGEKLTEGSAEAKGVGAGFKTDGEKLTELSVKGGPLDAKMEEGKFQVEMNAVSIGDEDAGVSLGGFAEADGKNGVFKGGVKAKGKVGDMELEGKAGVAAYLGSLDEYERAITQNVGFWEHPPELKKKVPWDKLPEKLRTAYEKALGWTKAEWEGIRTRPRPEDVRHRVVVR